MARILALFLCVLVVLVVAVDCAVLPKTVSVPFGRNYKISWGDQHTKILNGGSSLELLLNRESGAGFESKSSYLFGHFSMRMKLVPGDSAGVVTAFYLSSQNTEHDEIDFEFLGNRSGHPYILQTNVFAGGNGNKEQRTYFWFDPTKAFHSYSILWNMYQIVFFVDEIPIRVFKRVKGLRYPFNQPMKIYSSLWNADDWATRGGLEKTDWSKAPFVATYNTFYVDACEVATPEGRRVCANMGKRWWDQAAFRDLDGRQYRRMQYVKKRFLIYNYCTDNKRFPAPSKECRINRDI